MANEFEFARRNLELAIGGRTAEIVKVGSSQFTSTGKIYVRWLGGYDSGSGADTVRNPAFPARCQIPLVTDVGRLVWVGKGYDNQWEVKGNVGSDLEQANVNPRQLNPNDPSSRYNLIESLSNLQSFPTGGNGTVKVFPGVYRKPDGTYAMFPGQTAIDLLTSYTPATSTNQLIACLWLNTATGLITITASSELSQSTNLKTDYATAATYINECVLTAPSQNTGIWSYIIRGDDTVITEDNKFWDLRGIIGSGSSGAIGGFPIDVTSGVVIPSNTQIVVDRYTISSGGSVIINGRITVI